MTKRYGRYANVEADTLNIGGTEVTATAAELNLLDGAGAAVASGTQVDHITDVATDADGTALATAINSILVALEGFGLTAAQ